jgi:hypothetical protein
VGLGEVTATIIETRAVPPQPELPTTLPPNANRSCTSIDP